MISECKETREYEQLVADSHQRPVFVFKHSTSCPISASRWQVFQEFAENESRASFHRVLVIQDRPVARYIAQETGIPHASPQAILLHKGKPAWDASHYSITREGMTAALERVLSG